MASHRQRLDAARDHIHYICGRSEEQMKLAVPNCPGWTVYNAAVHVARVGVAWHAMIDATPDDPESRTRGYADAASRGSGHSPVELARWALAAVDALDGDVERQCYFSMTGGAGSVGLWGWHVASELAVHRLDIEHAVGEPHRMAPDLAADAIDYAARYFLPAMARVADTTLAPLAIETHVGNTTVATVTSAPGANASPVATLSGAPVDVLLALWGRPHGPVDVSGETKVFESWHALPSTAFQFGTWD